MAFETSEIKDDHATIITLSTSLDAIFCFIPSGHRLPDNIASRVSRAGQTLALSTANRDFTRFSRKCQINAELAFGMLIFLPSVINTGTIK